MAAVKRLCYGDDPDMLLRHVTDESVDPICLDPPFIRAQTTGRSADIGSMVDSALDDPMFPAHATTGRVGEAAR